MIDFLFWEGCPSHERALDRLTGAMDELGIARDQLRVTEVATHEDAERLEFIGSPTIRVDGVDVSDPGDTQYGLECRVYHRRDGRPSPLPDQDDIKEALRRYASQGKRD